MTTATYEEFERIINKKIDDVWGVMRSCMADTTHDRDEMLHTARGELDAYKDVLEMARHDWVEEQDGCIIETRPVGFTLRNVEAIIKGRWKRHVKGDSENMGYINAMSSATDVMKTLE